MAHRFLHRVGTYALLNLILAATQNAAAGLPITGAPYPTGSGDSRLSGTIAGSQKPPFPAASGSSKDPSQPLRSVQTPILGTGTSISPAASSQSGSSSRSIAPSSVVASTTSPAVTTNPIVSSTTPGLVTFSGTTSPTFIEISTGVSSDSHTEATAGAQPHPIFHGPSRFCSLFCPPDLRCDVCGWSIGLLPGHTYPPGSIKPPPGAKPIDITINVDKEGNPTYDEKEEPDEEPKSDTEPSKNTVSRTTASSTSPSSTAVSSCSTSAIVSNCNVICSSAASSAPASCSTQCSATSTGCGAHGSTITSIASASACNLIKPFTPVVTADETSDSNAPAFYPITVGTQTSSVSPTNKANPGTSASTIASSTFISSSNSKLDPTATSSTSRTQRFSCMGVQNPIDYSPSNLVCSCNNGQTYATMATYDGAGSCGYTMAPTAALPESAVVAAATPTAAYEKGTCSLTIQEGQSGDSPNSPVHLFVTFADNENHEIGKVHDEKIVYDKEKPLVFSQKDFKTSLKGDFVIRPEDEGDFRFSWINPDPKLQTWSSNAKYDINDVPSCSVEDWFQISRNGRTRNMQCDFECDPSWEPPANPEKRGLTHNVEGASHRDQYRNDIAAKKVRRAIVSQGSLPTRTLVRRDPDPVWAKYAPSGTRYWSEYQARDLNQPDDPVCNFAPVYDSNVRLGKLQKKTNGMLEKVEIATAGDYYLTTVRWSKEETSLKPALFVNQLNPGSGVIIAADNTKGDAPDHWSTIIWYLWQQACLSANPATNAQTADFSGIKYIVRKEITNPDTAKIIEIALKGEKDVVKYFEPSKPEDWQHPDNAFWALLGSPNGNGIINLLKRQKVAMHSKTIKRIGNVIDSNFESESAENAYAGHMWAEIG